MAAIAAEALTVIVEILAVGQISAVRAQLLQPPVTLLSAAIVFWPSAGVSRLFSTPSRGWLLDTHSLDREYK